MLFDNNDFYYYDLFSYNDERLDNKFLRGNMFDNEFIPFEKMVYVKPHINNEKDRLMYKIMESSFAINDYNLYLDLHPEDKNILSKYQKEVDKLNELTGEYTKKFGPLTLNNANYDTFEWAKTSFPWEVK